MLRRRRGRSLALSAERLGRWTGRRGRWKGFSTELAFGLSSGREVDFKKQWQMGKLRPNEQTTWTTNGMEVGNRLAHPGHGLSWLKLSHGQLLTSALLYNRLYWLFVEDSLKVIILSALHFSLSPSLFLSISISISFLPRSSAFLIPHFFSA